MVARAPIASADAMDDADRALLTLAQAWVPIVPRPFEALAHCLGQREDEVIARLAAMKEGKLIRKIGPVMEPAALGLASGLLAAKILPEHLDRIAADLAALPEITHCYAREHAVNLWVAGVAAGPEWFQAAVARLAEMPAVEGVWCLPTIRRFKIGVHFDLAGAAASCRPSVGRVCRTSAASGRTHARRPFLPREMSLETLRLVQSDLPLCPAPFAELAQRGDSDERELLETLSGLIACRAIRRYGAMVSHRRLGFTDNAMVVMAIAPERIEEAGRLTAESPYVSHCYQRGPLPEFPYNLYAMIHGRDREWCLAQAGSLAASAGASRWEALFSTREYGKSSPDWARLAAGVRRTPPLQGG